MRLHTLPLLMFVWLAAALSQGAAQTVDLKLALAVDASGSVSEDRFELQRHGYAEAFRNPRVLDAIQNAGAAGAIAVTLYQWTGASLQADVLPWTIVKDGSSANAVADAIEAGPRRLFGGGTSISGAIDYGVTKLRAGPFEADRLTIDVSGDGSNNSGRSLDAARDDALKQGVVINGLPILTVEPDLDAFYRSHVIGGAGSFVIAIKNFEAFADAIQRKLIAEISQRQPASFDARQASLQTSPAK